MLEEKFKSFLVALILNQEYPFQDELNELIFNLMAGGFIRLWEKENVLDLDGKKKDVFGPEALAMDELQIAFKICMLLFVISVGAFLLEFYFKHAEITLLILAIKGSMIKRFKSMRKIKVSIPKLNLKRSKLQNCMKLSKICKIRRLIKQRRVRKSNLKLKKKHKTKLKIIQVQAKF
jgi:hypothetical protein